MDAQLEILQLAERPSIRLPDTPFAKGVHAARTVRSRSWTWVRVSSLHTETPGSGRVSIDFDEVENASALWSTTLAFVTRRVR